MKRVLLLATTTGYQIRSFGEAARACGVRLVFASDRCDQLADPWWDGAIPVRFHEEARSLDAVIEAFGASPPDGVIAVGDRPTVLAARIAEAFHLPGNPPAAARASRNKLEMRRALAAAGLPVPAFAVVDLGANGDPVTADGATALVRALRYPLVVKPMALSGSRGVMRVDDAPGLAAALERLRRLLASADLQAEHEIAHTQGLVEEFIPGREFAVEGVLTRQAFRVLAIFDKPDPLDGPFFEETIYVTPSRALPAEQHAIEEAVAAAAGAMGLSDGPVHAECRVSARGVYVLEAAARPIGGLCSRALRFDAPGRGDVPLEEVLLRHALGEDVAPYAREAAASGVMMIPIPRRGVYRGVDGVDDARGVPGVEDVRITAKPDTLLVPLPEGRSYLGFIFARAATPAAAERALRDAHGRLQFRIEREVSVV